MNNVNPNALAYLYSPPEAWSKLSDCAGYPCTAPLNVLFDFRNTKYNSGSILNHGPHFQIIANNSGIAPFIKTCKENTEMNAYICKSGSLGILLFESEDADTEDRSM